MAKLSDFQRPAIPVAFVVDAAVMARNAKASASSVDWRKTKIIDSDGTRESDPFRSLGLDSVSSNRRHRMHSALDRVLDGKDGAAEETEANEPIGEALGAAANMGEVMANAAGGALQNAAQAALMESADSAKDKSAFRKRMHDALDTILNSRAENQNEVLHEPNEEEGDEEPEDDDDDSLDSAMDGLHKRLRAILHAADSDSRAARVIPSQHRIKISNTSGYITDAQFISSHLHPEMFCVDAERQLQDISFSRQKNDANRGYWSGLYYFLSSQPKGSRIRDIKNQVCLSVLLQHTLGGMSTAFGA